MSVAANLEREQLRQFVQQWDELLQAVPEARRRAVEAAGEAVHRDVQRAIQASDMGIESRGRVSSWQTLRLGSRGGWSAISAVKRTTVYSFDRWVNHGGRYRQHTWKGKPVTAGQLTAWLDQGHRTRRGRVPGKGFYSAASENAQARALEAAEQVLEEIAEGAAR